MPFVPAIGASVLGGLGVAGPVTLGAATAAGVGTIAAGGALVGSQLSAQKKAMKSANNASNDASLANAAAIQNVKDAQGSASANAQALITARRRTGSQTVYTSPLGATEQATTAKKTLLGE